MSEARVRTRTTDKFFETLGVSKKSNDSHLDECVDRLEAVKRQASSLRGVLERYFVGLRAYHDVSFFIAEKICTFYGSADKSSHVARAWKQVHDALDRALLTKLEPVYEKAVLGEADSWLNEIEEVFTAVRDREGLRLQYDHYRRKVSQLDEVRAKASAKGRTLKQKEQERLDRNREKLATWRDNLQAATDKLKSNINHLENSQHRRFDKVFQRLLQFEDKLFGETGRQGKAVGELQKTLAKQLPRDRPEWARLQERFEVEARAEEVLRERVEAMAVGEAKKKLQQMLAKAELPPSLADEVIGATPEAPQVPTAPHETASEGTESPRHPQSRPVSEGSTQGGGEGEDHGRGQQLDGTAVPAGSPHTTSPVSRESPVKTTLSAAAPAPAPAVGASAAMGVAAASDSSANNVASGGPVPPAAAVPDDWFGSDPFASGAMAAPAPAAAGAPDPFSSMEWSMPSASQSGGIANAGSSGADPFAAGTQDLFSGPAAAASTPPASAAPGSATRKPRWLSAGGGAAHVTSPALAGPGLGSAPASTPASTTQAPAALAAVAAAPYAPPSAHPPAASAPALDGATNPFDSFPAPPPSAPRAAKQASQRAEEDPFALFGQ